MHNILFEILFKNKHHDFGAAKLWTCKVPSQSPNWCECQNTVGAVHQSGRSWYVIQCKLQGTVALASSVFMQMADAMEGSKSQWGSECLRMWAADGHH